MAFCGKCGASIPDGSAFCPRCGQAASPAQIQPAAPAPPPRAASPSGAGLPPALASIFTPRGAMPFIATIVAWICWFNLPGATVSLSVQQLSATNVSATFWQALGLDPTNMTNMNIGGPGIVGVLIVICLLAPFAVPFIRNKSARLLYAAPLLAFIVGVAMVEHIFSAWRQYLPTQYFNLSDQGVIATSSLGIGAYLVGLASIAAAAAIVMPATPPTPARGGAPATAHVAPVNAPPVAPVSVAPPAAPSTPAPAAAPVQVPTAQAHFCGNCGKPYAAGEKFCGVCGASISS